RPTDAIAFASAFERALVRRGLLRPWMAAAVAVAVMGGVGVTYAVGDFRAPRLKPAAVVKQSPKAQEQQQGEQLNAEPQKPTEDPRVAASAHRRAAAGGDRTGPVPQRRE